MSVAVCEIFEACVSVSEVFSCCRKLVCTRINLNWKSITREKAEPRAVEK